jgi:hypothetical protein
MINSLPERTGDLGSFSWKVTAPRSRGHLSVAKSFGSSTNSDHNRSRW